MRRHGTILLGILTFDPWLGVTCRTLRDLKRGMSEIAAEVTDLNAEEQVCWCSQSAMLAVLTVGR